MDRDLATQGSCSGARRHDLDELDLENRLAELDTEAVTSGLPIHIAVKIPGHAHLSITSPPSRTT
ncbi:hypothetical protein [Mycobacterium attenuatum]|uniref:hypothetical protein n=1 Tax=Mycobacterium attenuatum TaxID=2341086 RepID=UPI0010A95336|nr:hypothetical protein [Mycobacterium attenuatum]